MIDYRFEGRCCLLSLAEQTSTSGKPPSRTNGRKWSLSPRTGKTGDATEYQPNPCRLYKRVTETVLARAWSQGALFNAISLQKGCSRCSRCSRSAVLNIVKRVMHVDGLRGVNNDRRDERQGCAAGAGGTDEAVADRLADLLGRRRRAGSCADEKSYETSKYTSTNRVIALHEFPPLTVDREIVHARRQKGKADVPLPSSQVIGGSASDE
ncbi:hypothetical protein [Sphingomonas sp. T9W2]|uniref:hypothetical protein n=1 Tax=Sphingomonas sp. T9W2 TaxID=3143183 RepID=UPI0031F4C6DF